MKTPITKAKLQNHFTYSLWKYALLAVVAIFGWNIVYSMTAYQPPESVLEQGEICFRCLGCLS